MPNNIATVLSRQDTWRGRSQRMPSRNISTGYNNLDLLLQGGWPASALVELMPQQPGIGVTWHILHCDRKCTLCTKNDLGDEFHYLFVCDHFSNERKKYLGPYFYSKPNTYKAGELFQSEKVNDLHNLAMFCKIIMQKFK